jgi:CheY-like chemotaxis protein
MTLEHLPSQVRSVGRKIATTAARGRTHQNRLEDLDIRVAVMGTRGKSSVVRWLYEELENRGVDTYAKVTGEEPTSLYDGDEHRIERSGPVTLYETEREIRTYDPEDAIVIENNGLRPYTTRLVNERYVDPTHVVLTNVRLDHLDTLGRDRRAIAQAFARAVPRGAKVFSGEQNDRLHDYLRAELRRRDATIWRPPLSGSERTVPGRECVELVDAVLDSVGRPLAPDRKAAMLDTLEPEWTEVPNGRVYDATNVNDVDSTELVRKALQQDQFGPIQPFVYLRGDRPGRTASFIRYLNGLAERGQIEQVRAAGEYCENLTRSLEVPVIVHDRETETPVEVLDAALGDPWPLMLMGNTNEGFVAGMQAEIDKRAIGALVETELPMPRTQHSLDAAPASSSEGTADPGPTADGASILVIEDEPDLLDLYEQILDGPGTLDVTPAADGIEGVEALDADTDLVLMDWTLPNLPGEELVTKLRDQRPEIPIVVISGTDPSDSLDRSAIDQFVVKPVSAADLKQVVSAHLSETVEVE